MWGKCSTIQLHPHLLAFVITLLKLLWPLRMPPEQWPDAAHELGIGEASQSRVEFIIPSSVMAEKWVVRCLFEHCVEKSPWTSGRYWVLELHRGCSWGPGGLPLLLRPLSSLGSGESYSLWLPHRNTIICKHSHLPWRSVQIFSNFLRLTLKAVPPWIWSTRMVNVISHIQFRTSPHFPWSNTEMSEERRFWNQIP